ncbi:MAG TPA: hypothetical protein VIF62_21030, partial [Labilithrix sp.]
MSTERTNAIPAPPSTAKTLVFPAVQVERPRFVPPRPPRLRNLTRAPSSSDTGVIELSASALEEILDDAMTPAPPKVAWPARALGRVADALRDRAARDEASRNARALERSIAASSVPPPSNAKPAFDDAWGAAAIAKLPRFVLGAAFVRGTAGPIAFALLAGALVEGSVQTAAARPEPHAAAFVHATLAHPRDGAFVDAPSGGCVALA